MQNTKDISISKVIKNGILSCSCFYSLVLFKIILCNFKEINFPNHGNKIRKETLPGGFQYKNIYKNVVIFVKTIC